MAALMTGVRRVLFRSLPRRCAGPTLGPHRAGRGARPLPRVDRRHRSRPALDHVNGPGLADAASLHHLVVARAAEVAEQSGGSRERRSYDSTLRRELAALTRELGKA